MKIDPSDGLWPGAFLSLFAASFGDLMRAVSAGCDRLVHPRVVSPIARMAQRRLLGSVLGAPLLVSAAAWMLLPVPAGIEATFAFICASFGMSGLLATTMFVTGRTEAVLDAASLSLAPQLAFLIAAAGGLQSPMALIAAAPALEAIATKPTLRAIAFGFAGAVATVALQPAAGVLLPGGATASIWHWLVPLLYVLSVVARMRQGSKGIAQDGISTAVQDDDRLPLLFSDNGDLSDAGAAAQSMLGVDGDLLLGNGFFERIHVADRVAYLCAFADLRGGARRTRIELRLRTPASQRTDGRSNYRSMALDLWRPEWGPAGIAGRLRDNGQVADLRAALAEAQDAAKNVDAARTHFLAAVSHELRTPLNSIIGFSDMLLCEINGTFAHPRQKEHVAIIREAGSHLLAVVNAALDVSKLESGCYATAPEPFPFHEAADLCVALMGLQAQAKGVALVNDVETAIGEINADRRAVQQMLINLVSNAVKFTPAGGAVHVAARQAGARLEFQVSDDGIGICAADMDRIGQPFAQVHNDYTQASEGAGLGLALVKGLVILHEGTMSIDSSPGKGTTVSISLPIAGPARRFAATGVLQSVERNWSGNGHGALRKAS